MFLILFNNIQSKIISKKKRMFTKLKIGFLDLLILNYINLVIEPIKRLLFYEDAIFIKNYLNQKRFSN
jgi:hypothetical protein